MPFASCTWALYFSATVVDGRYLPLYRNNNSPTYTSLQDVLERMPLTSASVLLEICTPFCVTCDILLPPACDPHRQKLQGPQNERHELAESGNGALSLGSRLGNEIPPSLGLGRRLPLPLAL